MNDQQTPRYDIDRTYEVNRVTRDLSHQAALARLKKILNTDPHLTDERGYIISTNEMLDDAQGFIRNYLDLPGDELNDLHNLPLEFAQHIIDDLRTIWGYEFYRDEISTIAMQLSLCPLHFCDWASCFDDEDPDCAQIRAAFPHSHDT